jgi:carboxyl-terminal processing protease
VNANEQGDYFDGMAVDKQQVDDVTKDFGDIQEACLKDAVNYLVFGTFVKSTPEFVKMPEFVKRANEEIRQSENAFTGMIDSRSFLIKPVH